MDVYWQLLSIKRNSEKHTGLQLRDLFNTFCYYKMDHHAAIRKWYSWRIIVHKKMHRNLHAIKLSETERCKIGYAPYIQYVYNVYLHLCLYVCTLFYTESDQ